MRVRSYPRGSSDIAIKKIKKVACTLTTWLRQIQAQSTPFRKEVYQPSTMKSGTTDLCYIVAASILVTMVAAQPFTVDMPEFEPDILEATKRIENNYTGFVFNFDTAKAGDQTPNGMLQANQVNSNAFLSTLPGDGNGQTLVTLGPCAGNTPHVHPRGSEISFVLYGSMQFGMIEENAGNNALVLQNITQNDTIHIPQGLLHFSFNPSCQPAAFLANFATKDPGTQTMWNSMMHIPNTILNMATGIPEATFSQLKSNYPLLTAPGTGGEACLAKCGLNFTAMNKLTPLAVTS